MESMEAYKGKVLLIVNTASKCGFTYQYEELQKLYEKYEDKGFVVLGFPCNQFGNQNPEGGEETARDCQINFGVTFPMYDVIEVNGENAHPLFNYLKQEAKPRPVDQTNPKEVDLLDYVKEEYPEFVKDDNIRWNFTKFLTDAKGNVVKRFEPTDSTLEIEKLIEQFIN